MVSTYQSNTSGGQFDTEAEKLLEKPPQVLDGVLRGRGGPELADELATEHTERLLSKPLYVLGSAIGALSDPDAAQALIVAEASGRSREKVIGKLNRTKAELVQ